MVIGGVFEYDDGETTVVTDEVDNISDGESASEQDTESRNFDTAGGLKTEKRLYRDRFSSQVINRVQSFQI